MKNDLLHFLVKYLLTILCGMVKVVDSLAHGCEFNNPPWFYVNLPATTSDNLELRICGNADKDVIISFIELYVQ